MYKKFLIALDNSASSKRGIELAIELGLAFSAALVGVHVTNPGLHEEAFRRMETELPEEYQDEAALQRQRKSHALLIERGLELISDSYIQPLVRWVKEAGLPCEAKILKGCHYEELSKELYTGGYDLAVFGAHGLGRSERSLIGSVVKRVAHRAQTDLLIIKDGPPLRDGRIVVGLDGSQYSSQALMKAIELTKRLSMSLEAVHVFNPQFHYVIFSELVGVLRGEAATLFNVEKQQDLHTQVIDRGLERVGQQHLKTAADLARAQGLEIKTTLLRGKEFTKIMEYIEEARPSLLVVGRFGRHRADASVLGATAENLLLLTPCPVLITA